MLWCKNHYSDFKKSIDNYNAMTYHDCCNCFSKRGFAKNSSHPPLQSAYILKIPTLRTVTSPEELCSWLKNRMKVHRNEGRKALFPGMNRHHSAISEDKLVVGREEQLELLKNKYENLLREKVLFEKKIEKLKDDNSRLQASSKSWMKLYHTAIFPEMASDDERSLQSHLQVSTTMTTPRRKTNSFLQFSEELNYPFSTSICLDATLLSGCLACSGCLG